jgi:hypothetical protein
MWSFCCSCVEILLIETLLLTLFLYSTGKWFRNIGACEFLSFLSNGRILNVTSTISLSVSFTLEENISKQSIQTIIATGCELKVFDYFEGYRMEKMCDQQRNILLNCDPFNSICVYYESNMIRQNAFLYKWSKFPCEFNSSPLLRYLLNNSLWIFSIFWFNPSLYPYPIIQVDPVCELCLQIGK